MRPVSTCRGCAVAAVILILLAGCGDDAFELVVQLKTDYRPREDFWVVRTTFSANPLDAGAVGARTVDAIAEAGVDYVAGRRVAEYTDVTAGTGYVRVALLDAADAEIAHRTVVLNLTGAAAVTILITASCGSVTCPSDAAHPERTECIAGRCEDPRCSEERPDLCSEPRCTSDGDCTAGVACAVARCEAGACLQRPNDAACPAGEVCTLRAGCATAMVPDAGPRDAGGRDAGSTCPGGGFEDTVALCANGADDDCDGRADCADGDCLGVVQENTPERCADASDNDCDGNQDCADPECAAFMFEGDPATCRDGLDNDCDGSIDCGDSDCHGRVCVAGQDEWRCCGGSCVNTFTDPLHCGSCGSQCLGSRPCQSGPDGHGRCGCSGAADCPSRGRWDCLNIGGTQRCDCLGDAACGTDFTCIMPAGEHSFCRATF